jgi:hypothetical protein
MALASPRTPAAQRVAGATLLETALVLAIVGLLALAGLARMDLGGAALGHLQGELLGSLEEALLRARAQGGPCRVALRSQAGDLPPLALPRGVRWGLPPGGIPLPPGMGPTVQAHRTGEAHAMVTVTPRPTAQASTWFLTDGADALCLRLNGAGGLHLFRFRHRDRRWWRL